MKKTLEKIDTDDTCNVVIGIVNIILENQKAMNYINAYVYWCKNG